MTKIDLKDAYFSVPIHPQSQKFLWQNKAFQFCSLPFGLNIAPSLFTRLMKPVAGFLRKRGVRLLLYLNDMLIIGSTPSEVNDFTLMAVNLLQPLGFIINLDNGQLYSGGLYQPQGGHPLPRASPGGTTTLALGAFSATYS